MKALLMLVVIMIMALAGCSSGEVQEESLLDTFPVDPDCEGNMKACCMQQCVDFCEGEGNDYYKHDINGETCMCWCN